MTNLIKLAIVAAGGNSVVSERFGVSGSTVSCWHKRGNLPIDHVRDLCAMGGNFIRPEKLLVFMADRKAAIRKAEAEADLNGIA